MSPKSIHGKDLEKSVESKHGSAPHPATIKKSITFSAPAD
jgi:hypothetical protein